MKKYPVYYYVIGAVVLLVVAYIAGQMIGKLKNKTLSEPNQAAKDLNPKNLSYQLSQYAGYADKVWEACNTMFSIDTDSIYNVFQNMKNKDDVLQLIKSFGVRPNPNWRLFGDDRDLQKFITYECSTSQVAKINSILSQNSIDFKF
jgi:hypothetical protein